ncbi:MAG: hypothetical protein ABIZ18_15725 [Caldimonas sp.]
MSALKAIGQGGEWLSLLFAALLLSACASVEAPTSQQVPETAVAKPAEHGAPAAHRSPFKEPPGLLLAEVTQANIDRTICVSGWTATVRPSTSFTRGLKRIMLARAGLPTNDAIKYELDHFVPLAIGGHPRSEDNLWLQRWDGAWNARVKDRLEHKLKLMVCAGQITLSTARAAVQDDWHAAYRKYVGKNSSALSNDIGMDEAEVVE